MAKHKKKHSKKGKDAVPDDILEAAALSIKKFRKVTNEIAKLSLGQKLAGSVALLAAGLIYLDQRKSNGGGKTSPIPKFDWPRLAEAKATSATEEKKAVSAAPIGPAAAPRKSRKSAKPGKTHGHGAKAPAEGVDDFA